MGSVSKYFDVIGGFFGRLFHVLGLLGKKIVAKTKRSSHKAMDRVKHTEKESFIIFLDKLSFFKILLAWISIIIIFGFLYFFLRNDTTYLYHNPGAKPVDDITNSIYFSFITSTTTGFGDIIPFGVFKFFAIVEVIGGLLLLAIVTSKLVSIKQNIILDELYGLSINEKVNRLRSSLLLFRQNLTRIINGEEEGIARKSDIKNIHIPFASFEEALTETIEFFGKKDDHRLMKTVKPVNTELIFNSVLLSFEKINDLICALNKNQIKWKNEVVVGSINKCIQLNDELFRNMSMLPELKVLDLRARKNKIMTTMKSEFERPLTQQKT